MSQEQALLDIAKSLDSIHQVLIYLVEVFKATVPAQTHEGPKDDSILTPSPAQAAIIFPQPNSNQSPTPANGFEPTIDSEQADAVYVDFEIDTITSSTDDNGRPVYKGRGHPYEKYGVRIWPEVFKRLGVNLEELVAGENQIHPIYARCVLNENGNPRKIVGIATGQAPAQNNNNPAAPPHPEPYPDRDIRPQPANDEIPF